MIPMKCSKCYFVEGFRDESSRGIHNDRWGSLPFKCISATFSQNLATSRVSSEKSWNAQRKKWIEGLEAYVPHVIGEGTKVGTTLSMLASPLSILLPRSPVETWILNSTWPLKASEKGS